MNYCIYRGKRVEKNENYFIDKLPFDYIVVVLDKYGENLERGLHNLKGMSQAERILIYL